MSLDAISDALAAIAAGEMVIVVDEEDRENEGDLTMAAEHVTPAAINFMATHGRGLICLPMCADKLDSLQIPLMRSRGARPDDTAFCVSIEARRGVSTGISAADRATTIGAAVREGATPDDLVMPGHVFPLRARPGGVLERPGQTEAAVDLARLAGLEPAGVICEVTNPDGSMARLPQLRELATRHGLRVVSVEDLITYRMQRERFVEPVVQRAFACELGTFELHVFASRWGGPRHLAFVKGSPRGGPPPLLRVQLASALDDVFLAARSPAGRELRACLRAIERAGRGALIYLRAAEPDDALLRELERCSTDPPATRALSFRDVGVSAQIAASLGIHQARLLSGTPGELEAFAGYGELVELVELVWPPT